MARKVVGIEETVKAIEEQNLCLCYDEYLGVDIWSPYRKICIVLRRSVYLHRQQLVQLMSQGDARLCYARTLHRKYWRRSGPAGRYICMMCQRIDRSLETVEQHQAAS